MYDINITPPSTIFIFCYTGLGNIVMFLPAYQLLREHFPEAHYVIAFDDRWYGDPFFLNQFGRDIETIHFPLNFKNKPLQLLNSLRQIRRIKADIAMMPFSGTSTKLGAFLLLSGVPRVAFFQTNNRWLNKLFKPCLPFIENVHHIERNIEIVRSFGVQPIVDLPIHSWIKVEEDDVKKISKEKNKTWIGIHTGGNLGANSARKWPSSYFRIIVERILREGDCLPILFGKGDNEIQDVREIVKGMEGRVKLLFNRPLTEVSAYIKSCDLFFGNDSGLMNLSVGVGTRTIAVLGPTNPKHTGPYGTAHRIVRLGLPCSPCFDSGYSSNCPHRNCLMQLSPEIAWQVISDEIKVIFMKRLAKK